ncbi:MAG TPA: dihydrolipoamide acetyltransferase family protein [Bacteroidales bacterium]|jgi:2-oxoglutarate dehydrogenase E2 component (dihydrolipoamide succinyltransferase)|nr:dihydrolipoamide acetyltransferase family protein [Bacteroidales bacterium]HOS71602.1 dihydrolipoamide acetyltransferase family protein [Bacteroidales bacterium]HQH24953.1 dihydrolipoamide acetyltransferase family protein [Bacteroidales bacterium]HQJ82357.1 dihydrolipoamide acetyltransferase family protein [Bacteroidales bacterium]
MAKIDILLPAMGEGVIEATITKWLVKEGSVVREDDPLVEVATDKVDSEIPAPADGKIIKITAPAGTVVQVGQTIAVIESDALAAPDEPGILQEVERIRETISEVRREKQELDNVSRNLKSRTPSGKFLSPLVRSIAARENISYSDLDRIKGTGMDGRITKDDVLGFLESLKGKKEIAQTGATGYKSPAAAGKEESEETLSATGKTPKAAGQAAASGDSGDEIIEMDRVRKIIAEHMVLSKKTSPHVTSFIDADVTKLVNWRNSVKDRFLASAGYRLTLTAVFIDATARALSELPMLNISVDGNNIIKKKNINIGMATALPDGNLIVPVIRNADEKNLNGLARSVSDLAERARNNKLKPDEITGGTFSLTNFGSFDNLAGTPIINQPQTAILGTGAVRKIPAVIETPDGDVIAIRHVMILSLSYDHRVIDGALAGRFLKKIKEILENYTPDLILH